MIIRGNSMTNPIEPRAYDGHGQPEQEQTVDARGDSIPVYEGVGRPKPTPDMLRISYKTVIVRIPGKATVERAR